MNKLLGFYELKAISIPTVQWKEFTPDTVLDPQMLWTIRVAVETGVDINLPRLVGASCEEAQQKGKELLERYREKGMVVYYPYFIADKSGVMEIAPGKLVIEAVDKDLWNFVSYGMKNVTIIHSAGEYCFDGEQGFLEKEELSELERYASVIRGRFRGELAEGFSLLAEWSFAYNTDVHRQPIGDRYLVFYELRMI